MDKRPIKNALAASLSAEETAFKARLAKADAVFAPEAATPSAAEHAMHTIRQPAPRAADNRVVRDSFTMPERDYARITEIRARCLKQGLHANKSEVLRAGLRVLCDLGDEQLAHLVAELEKVKTGRPAQGDA